MGLMNSLGMRLENPGNKTQRSFVSYSITMQLTMMCVSLTVCRYDFFLVSQHVRQGTVTPTHYNVVYDNSGLKPDHMQRCVRSSGYCVPLPLLFPVFHLLFSPPLPHGDVTLVPSPPLPHGHVT